MVSKAQTLSHKPIYPCAASVTAVNSNAAVLAAWKGESVKLASRGDKVFEKTTPAAFKTFIVADAKRLASLPGAVNGAIVKPTFDFGPFKDYITGGKLPADDQLVELQRKWDDVVTVVETLGQGGIAELTGVEFKTEEANQEQPAKDDRKNRRQANARNNRNARSAETSAAIEPVKFSYVFTFTAKPSALVKAINALATGERFTVVDNFTLNRSADTLFAAMGSEGKVEAKQASSGRHGRRRGGNAARTNRRLREKPLRTSALRQPSRRTLARQCLRAFRHSGDIRDRSRRRDSTPRKHRCLCHERPCTCDTA